MRKVAFSTPEVKKWYGIMIWDNRIITRSWTVPTWVLISNGVSSRYDVSPFPLTYCLPLTVTVTVGYKNWNPSCTSYFMTSKQSKQTNHNKPKQPTARKQFSSKISHTLKGCVASLHILYQTGVHLHGGVSSMFATPHKLCQYSSIVPISSLWGVLMRKPRPTASRSNWCPTSMSC